MSSLSKRGKYRMYSAEEKREYLNLLKEINIKKVANDYNVPLKNLKRWIKVGFQRKKGCGRKVRDPNLEKYLIDWYNYKRKMKKCVTVSLFLTKAKKFNKLTDFKASKGWLNKVKLKHNLYFDRLLKN